MIELYKEIQTYLSENPGIHGKNVNQHAGLKEKILKATRFLDEHYTSVVFGIRVYCILNNIVATPMCEECNERPSALQRTRIGSYCSMECSGKAKAKKRKISYKEKTGYEHPMHNPEVVEKQRQTVVERYGVEVFINSEQFKQKVKQTSLEKYGVDHPSKSREVVDNRRESFRQKYGVDNPFQLEEVREKAKQTLMKTRGVEHISHCEDARERRVNTNLERYGVANPNQSPAILEKRRQTNLKKYGVTNHRKKHYSEEYKALIQDPELLAAEYERLGSADGIAKEYGIGSHTTILNVLHSHGIDVTTNGNTYPEKKIQSILDSLGVDYIVGDRTVLHPKEVDILVPQFKLAIEVNGIYYHSTKFKANSYHQEKSLGLIEAGYKPFHIYEDQIKDERTLSVIEKKLRYFTDNVEDVVYARKCSIDTNVLPVEYDELYDNNHIQGTIRSSINIGLRCNSKLVACLSLSKTPKVEGGYTITRFCTDGVVVGGFSKLLRHFEKNIDWSVITTYASLDYSSGELYSNNGFEQVSITPPNYFYVDGRMQRYSRQQFMKHKLESRLEIYDEDLTEKQLMEINGYLRVYDSGSLKFIKQK